MLRERPMVNWCSFPLQAIGGSIGTVPGRGGLRRTKCMSALEHVPVSLMYDGATRNNAISSERALKCSGVIVTG